ncbi:hypothetical protein HD554DRAFT_1163308 [Boletus coccyginus]|nr:hypothetical protein HD554DRAFT_1163308 [Boletus coccyginus]
MLVRLTKYHELNCIRVVFRFLFTVPLVILGADGVQPHQHINDKMFATDLLGILAGIGCIVSSGITLVIFFPRSIQGEMTLKEQQRARRRHRAQQYLARWERAHTCTPSEIQSCISITQHPKTDLDLSFGMQTDASLSFSGTGGLPAYEVVAPRQEHERAPSIKVALEDIPLGVVGATSLQPNRRTQTGDVELGAVLTENEVELARARSERERRMSSLVHQWRSPIEIGRPTVSRWQQRV